MNPNHDWMWKCTHEPCVTHVFIHEWVPREIVLYMESKLVNHSSICPLFFSLAMSDFFLQLLFWDNGVGGFILLSFSVIVNVFLLNSAFDKQGGVIISLWSAVCLLIRGLCCVHRNIKSAVLVTWRNFVVDSVNHFRQRLCSSSLCHVVFRHKS